MNFCCEIELFEKQSCILKKTFETLLKKVLIFLSQFEVLGFDIVLGLQTKLVNKVELPRDTNRVQRGAKKIQVQLQIRKKNLTFSLYPRIYSET